MMHGSLFSGVGGFDIAAEWMGWENIFHCEINPLGRYELQHYHPKAISYEDITKTDFTIHRGTIDVLTGGFPCQPYSVAGKRKGKDDERHLWPSMLRAIREIQPRWVVGENVRGLISWNAGMVFDEVQSDLEAAGYEVLPFLLPACGVNAPHRRERIWIIAFNSNYKGGSSGFAEVQKKNGKIPERNNNAQSGDTGIEPTSHTISSDSDSDKRYEGRMYEEVPEETERHVGACDSWSLWNTWQHFPTQPPVRSGNDGLPTGLLRQRIREDSLGCLSEKEIDKIISKAATEWRKESIKAMGNSVVPQVVLQIFKAIEQYDETNKNWGAATPAMR